MKKSICKIVAAMALVVAALFTEKSENAQKEGKTGWASFWRIGAKASKASEEITPENEYYIGRAVAATLLTNYKLYRSSTLEQYLNKICQTLIINSDYTEPYNGYHVAVLDSKEVNAFATSGGHIFITRGLINCTEGEDELAAVVAHEIGHVQLKHGIKAIRTSRWAEAGTTALDAATASSEKASAVSEMVGDVMTNMVNNGYSKTQEYGADTRAIELMANAGYDINAMISMLKHLKEHQGDDTSGMYKTHPSPDLRISNANFSIKSTKSEGNQTSRYRAARYRVVNAAK